MRLYGVFGLEADILVSNALIIPMTERYKIFRRYSIVISDGKIVHVEPSSKIDKDVKAEVKIDARGHVALPGLINTHVHLYQNLLKGTIDNMPLIEWNNTVLIPLARVMRDYRLKRFYDLDYYVTLLAIIEMIKSGTTTFNCLDSITPPMPKAIGESGIRGVCSPVLVDKWLPEDLLAPLDWQVKIIRKIISKYMNAYDGRVKFMIGPTTVFTSTEKLLKEAMNIADEFGIGIHMHVNETKWEVEWAEKNLGMPIVKYLDSIGMLSRHFLAIHCVWCNDEELEIIKERNVHVSHNPESNMKLASGVAPVPKMLRMGINVALATDGAASNDNLDMIEAMRIAAMLGKVSTLDAQSIISWDVLEMATINGAKALGLEKEIGTIEEGKKADIILIDMRKPHILPIHDPANAVVYCCSSSDVSTVIVDGKLVMHRREILTINEKEVVKEAVKLGKKALKEAGFKPLY